MVDKEQDQTPAAQQLTPQTEEGSADKAENANETKVPKPHGGRAWAGLAIVLSFIALAASGYVAYTLYQKQALLNADVLGTLEQLKASVQQIEKNESQVEREVERIKKQFSDAKHVQDTLASAIEKVTNELGRNRTGWALAEIEQLLLIANYRLQLAHDPDTAIAALQAADRRLQQLAEPRLLPIRKLVATEITQLQSLERADVTVSKSYRSMCKTGSGHRRRPRKPSQRLARDRRSGGCCVRCGWTLSDWCGFAKP
jgi:uncharacterized protein HemX